MISLTLIIFVLLGITALIDIKTKKIPSIFLTGIIFLVAMVNMVEITFGLIHLAFGILAFIFAYMLYEARFIGGIADIKTLVIIGLLIRSIPSFFLFIILIMVIGFIYKLFFRYVLKKDFKEEIPFILALVFVYIILWFSGGLI